VVGEGNGALGDVPRLVPEHLLLVDEHPHQLGDGDRGVGVVEVDRGEVGQLPQVLARLAEPAKDVRDRAAHEEVLLLEPQLLALQRVVVGVEHLGDALGLRLALHRATVVAVVEHLKVELFGRPCRPEAQRVDGVVSKACDRCVVGDAEHLARIDPPHLQIAVFADRLLHTAVEVHRHAVLVAGQLPRGAVAQPRVTALDLPSAANLLVKDAELVANTVARAGVTLGRERVEKARGESAEAAVAEAGIELLLEQARQIDPVLLEHRLRHLVDAEVDQVVAQQSTEQELRGQVVGPLDALFVVGAGGSLPTLHQTVAHRVRERLEDVAHRGRLRILDAGVKQMVENGAPEGVRVHSGPVVLDDDLQPCVARIGDVVHDGRGEYPRSKGAFGGATRLAGHRESPMSWGGRGSLSRRLRSRSRRALRGLRAQVSRPWSAPGRRPLRHRVRECRSTEPASAAASRAWLRPRPPRS